MENQTKINTQIPLLLKNTKLGIWEYSLKSKEIGLKDFNKLYYQYKLFAYGKERVSLDPYAKSMAVFDSSSDDKTGKGAS